MISFGPVPSRRLGRSLGINNIVTPKICSYNCVYCQVGKTTKKSAERQVFFRPEVIFRNVEKHLKKLKPENHPDFLTFVSNGEPTLDINLSTSIELLKKLNIPIAIITNASMIFHKSVRDDLQLVDWVSLKMDAGDNDTWQRINRPFPGLEFKEIIENIQIFASEYKGTLCTETMLVDGLNDKLKNLTTLSEMIKQINPWKAYIAIPTRPPAEKSVNPPDVKILNHAWQIFNNLGINTELLTGFEGIVTDLTGNIYEDILNITAVHPLREDSMLNLLHNNNADLQIINSLIRQRLIRSVKYLGHTYYLREYHINT